jgi:hypothetical protein
VAYRIRETEIDVRWPMPDDMGAPITKYRIQYRGGEHRDFTDANIVTVKFSVAAEGGLVAMEEDKKNKLIEGEKLKESIYRSKVVADKAREKKKLKRMVENFLYTFSFFCYSYLTRSFYID